MAGFVRTLGLSVPVTEALDPKLWRERYARGVVGFGAPLEGVVSLSDALGCQSGVSPDDVSALSDLVGSMPDSTIRWHLRAAMSELEVKLGIQMGVERILSEPLDPGEKLGVTFDRLAPRIPYTRGETLTWFRIDLPFAPVLQVERIRGFYYGTPVWDLSQDSNNDELIRIEHPKQGILHILPTRLESLIVADANGTGSTNYGIWHTINLHNSPIPDFWAIDYLVGPVAKDGQVGHIEVVLAHWIAARAALPLLSMAGLAASKGLTSQSVSFDGISRSVGLQASAIYGLNSALEEVYRRVDKEIDWRALRSFKRGLRLRMYSY